MDLAKVGTHAGLMQNGEKMKTTAVKERPILMCSSMVRATLAGLKTNTRRIVKPQVKGLHNDPTVENPDKHPLIWVWRHDVEWDRWIWRKCPFGKPEDRLYVRETWRLHDEDYSDPPVSELAQAVRQQDVHYRADEPEQDGAGWRPSIHMPRWASRITLEITDIQVERLHEITEAGAKAEGLSSGEDRSYSHAEHGLPYTPYKDAFEALWDKLYGKKHSWLSNPWVWSIRFKRI